LKKKEREIKEKKINKERNKQTYKKNVIQKLLFRNQCKLELLIAIFSFQFVISENYFLPTTKQNKNKTYTTKTQQNTSIFLLFSH